VTIATPRIRAPRRGLRLAALVAIGATLVLGGVACKPLRDKPRPTEGTAAAVSPVPVEPDPAGRLPDMLGALRTAASPRLERPDWFALADALTHLKTLDGAGIDPETGQLLLVGEQTDGVGPFRLEDVAVTLRAAFREREAVGMTIDENPDDKEGPWMFVKFFGGTRDTHIGQVMFECDRLMKSLGQGADSITKQPLASGVPAILTHAEYSQQLDPRGGDERWSRFWITLSTGRTGPRQAEGKPWVDVSDDKGYIWFANHRMYVDTEQMLDPGRGARLRSSGGRQSRSSRAFADALTEHYDELAKRFPVFGELKELSKLVVLAEWIHEHHPEAIDPELVLARFESSVRTPDTTPTLATTRQASGYVIKMLGGVMLAPDTRYVRTAEQKATELARAGAERRAELRRGEAVPWVDASGVRRQIVALGPPVRGPTSPAPRQRRRTLRVREASGNVSATSLSEAESADRIAERFGGVEPAVWVDPGTGIESLDLPVLRRMTSARKTRIATFTEPGGATKKVEVPASLHIDSPSRDISIAFTTDARYDAVNGEAYFASKSSDAVRFYASRNELRLGDGSSFRFGDGGILTDVSLPQGRTFRFEHRGPPAPPPRPPDTGSNSPRGPPPLSPRESLGDITPTSRVTVDTVTLPEIYIREESSRQGVRFRGERGRYVVELD
jgi:hypothetical protein